MDVVGQVGRIIKDAAERTRDQGGLACAKFVCFANASAGSFAIPAAVLLALPVSSTSDDSAGFLAVGSINPHGGPGFGGGANGAFALDTPRGCATVEMVA